MTTTRPGWYPDPSGRFPKRWHDGYDWTASVLDGEGRQSYDQLPPVGATAALGPPAAPSPAPPPPPPAAASGLPPPGPPPTAAPSWDPRRQPHEPSGPAPLWPPAVTTASFGLTPARPGAGTGAGASTVALLVGTVGTVMIALSLFVLDWAPSRSFDDLRTYVADAEGLEWPDTLVKAYTQWLGYAWVVLTGLAVAFATAGRSSARRLGHVGAALAAAVGAVLSAFVVVRSFVGPGQDPEVGAWLLVGGYLVTLAGVVVSARRC